MSVGHSNNEMEIGKASLKVLEKAVYVPAFSINQLEFPTFMMDLEPVSVEGRSTETELYGNQRF